MLGSDTDVVLESSDVPYFSPSSNRSGIWPFLANLAKFDSGQIFGWIWLILGDLLIEIWCISTGSNLLFMMMLTMMLMRFQRAC